MSQAKLPSDSVHDIERRSRRFWVGLIVMMLSIQVVIGGISLYLAVGEPSAVPVPQYHQAALDWDRTHRQRTAAARLNLKLTCSTTPDVSGSAGHLVWIQVRDSTGSAVDDLSIRGTAYHHKQPGKLIAFPMHALGQGRYQSPTPLTTSGIWSVEVLFEYHGETVSTLQELDLPDLGEV